MCSVKTKGSKWLSRLLCRCTIQPEEIQIDYDYEDEDEDESDGEEGIDYEHSEGEGDYERGFATNKD